MNKIKITIGVLIVIALFGWILYFTNPVFLGAGSGPAHWQNESFLQGMTAGTGAQFSVSNVGALTIGSSGTAVSNYYCGSVSYNPPSRETASSTSTGFSLTGVALGDTLVASFATSTQGIELHPYVNHAGSTTVSFVNNTGGTIDLATSTLKVCYTQ